MTTEELIEQQAAAFKARMKSLGLPKPVPMQGHSGPLGDVFLPPEIVDQMEAAINEAFEHVENEQVVADDESDD